MQSFRAAGSTLEVDAPAAGLFFKNCFGIAILLLSFFVYVLNRIGTIYLLGWYTL
jgi:hypothetical protein